MIRGALALLLPPLLLGPSAALSASGKGESDCELSIDAAHLNLDFAAYHVPVDQRPPVPTRLRTRHERFFATRLRNAYRGGNLFAGHYAVAIWGCGAGCREIAFVDYRSGIVHWSPLLHQYTTLDIGVDRDDVDAGVRFKPDSRLIAFVGTPNLDANGTPDKRRHGVSLFEWRNDGLHLLRFVPARKICPGGTGWEIP